MQETAFAILQAQARDATRTLAGAAHQAAVHFGENSTSYVVLNKAAMTGDLHDSAEYRATGRAVVALIRPGSFTSVGGFLQVPPDTPVIVETTPVAANFIAEGAAKPTGKPSFDTVRMPRAAGIKFILPATMELLRQIGAAGEVALSQMVVTAARRAENVAFFDPTWAGNADVSPSVLYGVTPLASTGNVAHDVAALLAALGANARNVVFACSPATALALHGAGFEGASIRGGDVAGAPLFVDDSLTELGGSNGPLLAAFVPQRIMLVDDGVTLGLSKQATVQMSGTPDEPTAANTVMVNLWQRNLAAIRVERFLNWKTLDGAAAYVTGASYGW